MVLRKTFADSSRRPAVLVEPDQQEKTEHVIDPAKPPLCTPPPKIEPEGVDPLTVQVFHALGRVIHLNRLLMIRMMAQGGVHHAEVTALLLLSQDDGMTQRDLAKTLHLSSPRVSTVLGLLEQAGAIERRVDEADRRLARVYLTEEGRRRQREQQVVLGEYIERTIGALPEADRRELGRLLAELADRAMAMLQEEPPGKAQEGAPTPR